MPVSVAAPLLSLRSVMARFEGEVEHFGQRDLGPFGDRDLYVGGDSASVNPRPVAAQVGDAELAALGVAAKPDVFAGDLVGGVERDIDPERFAPAADGDF